MRSKVQRWESQNKSSNIQTQFEIHGAWLVIKSKLSPIPYTRTHPAASSWKAQLSLVWLRWFCVNAAAARRLWAPSPAHGREFAPRPHSTKPYPPKKLCASRVLYICVRSGDVELTYPPPGTQRWRKNADRAHHTQERERARSESDRAVNVEADK
jgi:hypothetical protein